MVSKVSLGKKSHPRPSQAHPHSGRRYPRIGAGYFAGERNIQQMIDLTSGFNGLDKVSVKYNSARWETRVRNQELETL
jgi:hypothetical protein